MGFLELIKQPVVGQVSPLLLDKTLVRQSQKRSLDPCQANEINMIVGKSPKRIGIIQMQDAILGQGFEINQAGIASKCRQAGIRRIAESGWSEWQRLPIADSRILKEINKSICRLTEDANPLVPG